MQARLMLFPKEREKRGGVDGEWAVLDRLVERSIQRSYLRLRENVTKGAKTPLTSLQAAELTGLLSDEIALDRDQFCPAFKVRLFFGVQVAILTDKHVAGTLVETFGCVCADNCTVM